MSKASQVKNSGRVFKTEGIAHAVMEAEHKACPENLRQVKIVDAWEGEW